MNRQVLFFMFIMPFVLTACSNQEDEPTEYEKVTMTFNGYIHELSRATETSFEVGDMISVFATNPTDGLELSPNGNYADNFKYIYSGSEFVAASADLEYEEGNPYMGGIVSDAYEHGSLAFYAVYPYQENASNVFTFTAKNDQSTKQNYMLSDLCTSYAPPTNEEIVDLEFFHRMSNVVVRFNSEIFAQYDITVKLDNVFLSAIMDMNECSCVATGARSSVVMGNENYNTFHAYVAPQKLGSDFNMVVMFGGVEYNLKLASDLVLESGKQLVFEFNADGNNVVELNGHVQPWGIDPRFADVVPAEIVDEISDYMPIHIGINPPNIEGSYFIDPLVAVYCEDAYFSPGDLVNSIKIKFSNQNEETNTLDYAEFNVATGDFGNGNGAFISGSGDNFTAFFNVDGAYADGVTTYKEALVISGTKTAEGIKNLYYAFVMIETNDPNNILVEEGVYRIFKDKDGISVDTTFDRSRSSENSSEISRQSAVSFVR